tara:strand:+ start:58646 stop:60880 length:2235 start_codon:yes stop_codon:yes gene_type:complete
MDKKLIIATVGPSSMNKQIVQKMDASGVDIFRINLSHTTIEDFVAIYEQLSKWTSKPICPDTEGAQLRTAKLIDDSLFVKDNNFIELVGVGKKSEKQVIPLNILFPEKIFLLGDLIKIDFDGVLIKVIDIKNKKVICKVIKGGVIGSNKGISIDRAIKLEPFSKKDLKIIELSNKLKINTIFLSFCSNGQSISYLRDLFDYQINIISKVENQLGLKNIDEICVASDGILIDRGDLSRDVAIEKIAFAQSYIMEKGIKHNTPVYTATNFLESMIEKSKPTRSEIHDIVSTLNQGGSGIVLAAETAIGKYPVDCVRIISRIINEHNNSKLFFENSIKNQPLEYLLSLSMDGIIKPHGENELVNQVIYEVDQNEIDDYPMLQINEKNISDVIQICEGVYTPLREFMDIQQIDSVLSKNKLLSGSPWTMPIIFQVSAKELDKIIIGEKHVLKDLENNHQIGLIEINKIEKIKSYPKLLIKWFGTDDSKHPGVKDILNGGEFLVSGKPYLFNDYRQKIIKDFEFTPKQTREIFYHNGWNNVVGFHTRNIPHGGHEYIQQKALELSNADAILLSPVTGKKKPGDFKTDIIVECYKKLISDDVYLPNSALLSAFNTYSRYAGPREAVFTAICRKNFGCNFFIVGRDHTGVGSYYRSDASINIFKDIDLGIEILPFDTASYCSKRKIITDNFNQPEYKKSKIEISGTLIRELLQKGEKIPSYLMRTELTEILENMFKNSSNKVFYNVKKNKT